jgi:hypothetical protein
MPERVAAGEVIKLTIAKPFVVLVNADVRWCLPAEDGNGFQVGMRVLDNLGRLEALHRALNEERGGSGSEEEGVEVRTGV